eukprot:248251_1
MSTQDNLNRLQKKLNNIASSDIVSPLSPYWSDNNRNGVLSMYGLSRWTHFSPKVLIDMIMDGNLGFAIAKHVTFHNVDECLNASKPYSSMKRRLIDRKLIGMPSLQISSYLLDANHTSHWHANHTQNVSLNNKDDYVGHAVGLYVNMNRATRKPKALSDVFKNKCKQTWNDKYPQDLKPVYIKLKNITSNHLQTLKKIKMDRNYNDILFSYNLQLRYMDEDRNHHLNFRSYFSHIEECLMHYDNKFANNKYVNYSMTIAYWKETAVRKYKQCFVNIC